MSTKEQPEISHEDLTRIARYLVGQLGDNVEDKEEYFQIAFLEGLEALERLSDKPIKGKASVKVFGAMKAKVSHAVSFSGSPVEVPSSSANHSALAKVRRGEPAETDAEKRVAAILAKREEVLPITLVTHDTPETLLEESQLVERLKVLVEYCLTPIQKDAVGVVFFGEPLAEEFMMKYEVGAGGVRWHSEQALKKLHAALTN